MGFYVLCTLYEYVQLHTHILSFNSLYIPINLSFFTPPSVKKFLFLKFN